MPCTPEVVALRVARPWKRSRFEETDSEPVQDALTGRRRPRRRSASGQLARGEITSARRGAGAGRNNLSGDLPRAQITSGNITQMRDSESVKRKRNVRNARPIAPRPPREEYTVVDGSDMRVSQTTQDAQPFSMRRRVPRGRVARVGVRVGEVVDGDGDVVLDAGGVGAVSLAGTVGSEWTRDVPFWDGAVTDGGREVGLEIGADKVGRIVANLARAERVEWEGDDYGGFC